MWVEIHGSFLSLAGLFIYFFGNSIYTEKLCEAVELEPRLVHICF